MGKNTNNKKFGRLVVVLFLVVSLMFSAAQALMIQYNVSPGETKGIISSPLPLLQDDYYTWEDLFTDATQVDPSMSYN
jgi:hypothetical protein